MTIERTVVEFDAQRTGLTMSWLSWIFLEYIREMGFY